MMIRFLCPALLALLLLTSCRPVEPVRVEPTPTPTPTPVVVQPTPTPIPHRAPADHHWPGLFLSEDETRPRDVAIELDGLVVTPQEYTSGLERYMDAHSEDGSEEAYRRDLRDDLLLLGYLRDSGLMEDKAFETRARQSLRSVLADLVLAEANKDSLVVTDGEIRARYQADIDKYRQPRRVKIRLILVSTATEGQAVMDRLDAGESFASIAAEVSQHPSRENGGDIEPFSEGTYSPALEDLAFSLGVGDTGTVTTNRGVFIVQKLSDMSATVTPLEDVRDDIARTLREEKWEAGRRALLDRLEREEPTP
ncbi:peptidyl-prolyl cis-trans isomerase [bacterium]|nr:peptidyl-prolyl cis-trans isomerase [bacterium]